MAKHKTSISISKEIWKKAEELMKKRNRNFSNLVESLIKNAKK